MDYIYVIKKNGKGALLSYTKERYSKFETVLKNNGFRKATKEEVSMKYDLKEVNTEAKEDAAPKKVTKNNTTKNN